MFLKIPI